VVNKYGADYGNTFKINNGRIVRDGRKKELRTMSEDNRAAIRLRAIVSVKECGVNVVAKVFNITGATLRSWIKSYQSSGVAGLEYQPGRGRKSKLLDLHREAIRRWTGEDCNLTLNAILIKLEEEYQLSSSKSAVHRALHELGISYITPRPQHYKQDKSHVEFKKKAEARY
jgi:transposase